MLHLARAFTFFREFVLYTHPYLSL